MKYSILNVDKEYIPILRDYDLGIVFIDNTERYLKLKRAMVTPWHV